MAPETFDFDVFEEGTHSVVADGNVCSGGRTSVDAEGRQYIDFDGDDQADFDFSDQNFNVRSLVGNVVFRWEYRPGSMLFLVWQRTQEDEIGNGRFDLGRDVSALLRAPAENAFIVKVNYWLAF